MGKHQSEIKSRVIIGIGNKYRCDDAAGILIAERLSELMNNSVKVLFQDGEATRLIESWSPNDMVVIVDSTSSGLRPGRLSRFDVLEKPLPATVFKHSSSHSFSLYEAIELARTLDRLPSQLVIYGIEGKNFDNGTDVSPEVRSGLELAAEKIADEVNSWR